MFRFNHILAYLIIFYLLCTCSYASSEAAFDSAEFILPEGYTILDGTWIAGKTDDAFLLIGSKEDNSLKLAVATQIKQQTYQVVATSKPLLPYDDYVSGASHIADPWQTETPYFWWGAGKITTEKEIYIVIEMNESHSWYVSHGFIADSDGNTIYSFDYADNESVFISGETPYPIIRWRTNVSLLLEGFDITTVEALCMNALEVKEEVFENYPCFMELRIE